MDQKNLRILERFLNKASLVCFASEGGNQKISPWLPGQTLYYFKEKIDGVLYEYFDSYAGHYQFWGSELVWINHAPLWQQNYGGGVLPEFFSQKEFTSRIYNFLKKALSAKEDEFQPRGPRNLVSGDFSYVCSWGGNIESFDKGEEWIYFKEVVVYSATFSGGIFI